MKQLQIDERKVRALYATASPEFRQTLEDSFGKDFFSKDICERINSLEDCHAETGRPVITDFSIFPEDLRSFFKRMYDGVVMTEAYNQGVKLDYKDENQKKWRIWLKQRASGGVGYNVSYYDCSTAAAGDASRLAFADQRLSKDAFEKFPELYEDILNF